MMQPFGKNLNELDKFECAHCLFAPLSLVHFQPDKMMKLTIRYKKVVCQLFLETQFEIEIENNMFEIGCVREKKRGSVKERANMSQKIRDYRSFYI